MSTRSYLIPFPTRLEVKATGLPDSIITSYTSGSYVRTGVNNPNYRSQIIAGSNASNAMTVDIDVPFSLQPSTALLWYSTYPFTSSPQDTKVQTTFGKRPPPAGFAYPSGLDEWEKVVRVKASMRFLQRVKEEDHKFQGGVFFGEIVPTLRMLTRPFASLRDGLVRYTSTAKYRLKGAPRKSWRRILSDTWLEYSFGWKPLLADARSFSEAAFNIYENLRRKRISSGIFEDATSTPTSIVRDYLENLMLYDVFFSNDVKYSVKYYGGLEPLPNASSGTFLFKRIMNMSSFDLSSFIPTVWELIPYSFLVDYFSTIGDVLNAYSVDTSALRWVSLVERRQSGQTIRWDYLHQKTRLRMVGSTKGHLETRCITSGQGATYGSSHINIIRWTHASLTYPGLTYKLPIDIKQFANMAALLAKIKS